MPFVALTTSLQDKIVPHAIMWFVGEAQDSDDESSDEDDSDDEDGSDDEDDDSDDEKPRRPKGKKQSGFAPADGEPPAEQPECKQQ